MAESDQPLSLNERSARVISLLSPPPPSASSPRRSKEFRVRKIKIEGRRRLCKISSESAPDDSPIDAKLLDSPPRERPQQDTKWLDSPDGQDGGENIQDILDCLTARLETLSVQKSGPRARTPLPDPEPMVKHETYNFNLFPSPEKKEDFKERVKAKGKAAVDVSSDDDEGSCLVLGGNARKGSSGYPIQKTLDAQPRPKPCLAGNLENRDWSKDGGRDIPFAVREQGVRRPLRDVSPANSVLSENYAAVSCEEDEGDDDAPLPIRMVGTGVCSSSKYELPGKLAKMLYRHQRDGLKWLWSLHCRGTGGILGDDMGLGKTMQVSAFLAGLFHSRLIRRALIVAPKTLLGHWMKELSVVGLAKNTRDYSGPSMKLRQYELQYILKEGGILLTTYDIVRNNSKSIRGDWYVHRDQDDEEAIWDYIILDEGHIVKNPKTQRAKSLHEIPSVHRIIISGTPIQNNLKELWALFNFCCPEILGDKDMFKIKYENPIIKGNDKNASDRNKHYGSSVAKELRERIKPYFLRRLKSEVFLENDSTKGETLSKKNEIIVWLKLTPLQRQLYEAFLNSELVHSSVDGSPLAALTILKKICDHPLLLTKKAAEGVLEGMDTMLNHEDRNMVEEMAMNLASRAYKDAFKQVDHTFSCKICFIMILLENLVKEGHTVLIFSQTRKMLDLIQEAIVSAGYKFLRIDGTAKVSDREKIVKDFQGDSGAPIFLLTSQVGGLGLTLTKADRVIVVDPAWNPSTDNQSVDRAYRIGQTKDVLVYRLMTCGTIEEKIYKMQVFKGGLFRTATEHKEQTRYFSQKDIKELFSLPEQGFDVSLTQKQLHEEHDQHHTMEESVVNHIKFLEKQGIAGISHHSLLYSKTATLPFVPAVEVQSSKLGNRIIGSFASSVSVERVTDGAEFAFKPKDQKFIYSALSSGVSPNQTQESPELIEERLKRLSQTLANKALVSKLPDRGARIHKQISELDALLREIRDSPATQASEKDFGVVDSDGLADEMKRVLSV